MRFRVLGPLRVRSGGGWVPVAAPQQRVVLAMLLADAGQVVSSEKLVDAVWPDRPPRRPVNTIAVYVMRIRRLVGDGVVVTRGGGYALVAGDGDVDAVVFERLLAAARREREDGRLAAADGRLGEALALWRGPVLADVPASASMTAWVSHLAQLRLAAEEDRVDVLVRLGRHAEVVDEARLLVERSPLRERRWVLLMTALHRCGLRGLGTGRGRPGACPVAGRHQRVHRPRRLSAAVG